MGVEGEGRTFCVICALGANCLHKRFVSLAPINFLGVRGRIWSAWKEFLEALNDKEFRGQDHAQSSAAKLNSSRVTLLKCLHNYHSQT